jgi:hypothetical protein
MNSHDPLNLAGALAGALTSREKRDTELTAGFTSTTPYDESNLRAASVAQRTIEVVSTAGFTYGLTLRPDMRDGSVTALLATVDGAEPSQDDWRRLTFAHNGGYKHTLSQGTDGMIQVKPGHRAC